VGTVRILYGASTISLQAAVHPEHRLKALNMKEEEHCCSARLKGDETSRLCIYVISLMYPTYIHFNPFNIITKYPVLITISYAEAVCSICTT